MLHEAWQPSSVVPWTPGTHEPLLGWVSHSALLVHGTSTVTSSTFAVHGTRLPTHTPPKVGVQLRNGTEAQLRHPLAQHPCSRFWMGFARRSGYLASHVARQTIAP